MRTFWFLDTNQRMRVGWTCTVATARQQQVVGRGAKVLPSRGEDRDKGAGVEVRAVRQEDHLVEGEGAAAVGGEDAVADANLKSCLIFVTSFGIEYSCRLGEAA